MSDTLPDGMEDTEMNVRVPGLRNSQLTKEVNKFTQITIKKRMIQS